MFAVVTAGDLDVVFVVMVVFTVYVFGISVVGFVVVMFAVVNVGDLDVVFVVVLVFTV